MSKVNNKKTTEALMNCAVNGNIEEFKKYFINVNNNNIKFDYILEKAIEFNNLNIIEYIIDNIDNKKMIKCLINNMFIKTSIYGQYEIMMYFINKGADIHYQNDSAIRFSAKSGHVEIVEELISRGANIHADDDFALSMSVYAEHIEVVKILLENNANIHVMENDLFKYAAKNKNVTLIQVLFEKIKKIDMEEISNLILEDNRSSIVCIDWIKRYMSMIELNDKLNNDLISNICNNSPDIIRKKI